MYTLPVIDEDGDITGIKGNIIVASKEIFIVPSIDVCKIGCGVLIEDAKEILPETWKSPTPYRLRDRREFQLHRCTFNQTNIAIESQIIWLWERIK